MSELMPKGDDFAGSPCDATTCASIVTLYDFDFTVDSFETQATQTFVTQVVAGSSKMLASVK
jgi:hypothetical protein